MSRISDTRFRTREAAARLVAAGRLPHELTVDLIYAEIRQGSRTTINDELKLWKDEQARIDALSAALPPTVANAMLSVWALAVEHGEQVFAQRGEELETEATAAAIRAESLATANDEIVRMLGRDIVLLQFGCGKILAVERNNKFGARVHSRSHNMPIIRVWKFDRRDKVLEVFDQRFAYVRIHELTRARDSFRLQIFTVLEHVPCPLIVDHVAPSRAIHVSQRKMHQQVP